MRARSVSTDPLGGSTISWDLRMRLEPCGRKSYKNVHNIPGGTRPDLTRRSQWTIYWFFSTYIPKRRNTDLNLDCDDHRNQLFIKLLHHHQLFKSQAAQSAERHTQKQTKGEVEVQTALLVCFHMLKHVSHAQQVNLFIKQWDERFTEENAAAPPESSKE